MKHFLVCGFLALSIACSANAQTKTFEQKKTAYGMEVSNVVQDHYDFTVQAPVVFNEVVTPVVMLSEPAILVAPSVLLTKVTVRNIKTLARSSVTGKTVKRQPTVAKLHIKNIHNRSYVS